jgi:biopolymer transport protein ExbB
MGWLKALQTMIAAIPLLGLLGTIIGLLDIFFALSHQAQMSMSDGIAKALFTTQMGMLMTIPAMVMLWFLQTKAKQLEAQAHAS